MKYEDKHWKILFPTTDLYKSKLISLLYDKRDDF